MKASAATHARKKRKRKERIDVARGPKAPATPPCSGKLTIDERDAINAAKQRAKDMLTLVLTTLNEDDVLIVGGLEEDADRTGAVLTACEIIRESLRAIDEAFHAADARQEAAAAANKTGGAK